MLWRVRPDGYFAASLIPRPASFHCATYKPREGTSGPPLKDGARRIDSALADQSEAAPPAGRKRLLEHVVDGDHPDRPVVVVDHREHRQVVVGHHPRDLCQVGVGLDLYRLTVAELTHRIALGSSQQRDDRYRSGQLTAWTCREDRRQRRRGDL